MSYNSVTLVGNLGADAPEVRTGEKGEEFVTFSFATHDKWKDKNDGSQREKTEWHNVAVFQPGLVEIVKNHVVGGKLLLIQGRISYRTSEDESGNKKYYTDIVARDIRFLPEGKSGANTDSEEAA